MMVASAAWYPMFPGAVESEPFSAHFIRDIGAVFLVIGAALVCFANDSQAHPAGSRHRAATPSRWPNCSPRT